MVQILHHMMTLSSFFNKSQRFYHINQGRLNQTEVRTKQKLVARKIKNFKCIKYCTSYDSLLPMYEEMREVEKFKSQNQDMILNITEFNNGKTKMSGTKMTKNSCNISTFMDGILFKEERLKYFVLVRTGIIYDTIIRVHQSKP